jgi:hypothetical protein
MPLDVTLLGPDGELVDHVLKSQDGELLRSDGVAP